MQRLIDLVSVGPKTLEDFQLLGINTVEQLKNQSAQQLYQELCIKTGIKHDICCLDVFQAAIAQAKNPNLPVEQKQWWYWSTQRKLGDNSTP